MVRLDIRTLNADEYLPSIISLARDVELVEHHRALADHRWIDLSNHALHTLDGLMALDEDSRIVAGILTRTATKKGMEFELVVRPSYPYALVAGSLLHTALEDPKTHEPQRISLWIPNPSAERDGLYRSLGFRPDREVIQMRRSLPVEGLARDRNHRFRQFNPGTDEAAWLQVNNRAFEWHPDQGDWDLATLAERESEPWFDPAGFFILEQDDRIGGFCWTKIHYDCNPAVGEIYVIAVDPELGGKGLGKAILTEGLYYLGEVRQLSSIMLYVERSNTAAQRLYHNFGFTVDHCDRRYILTPSPLSDQEHVHAV